MLKISLFGSSDLLLGHVSVHDFILLNESPMVIWSVSLNQHRYCRYCCALFVL